ncbi:unnamed protein product [Paramecium pentaurelia]|uniref:Serine aminopeptidase S33 domain-containing protein n=1 Tax=Paramecium pentaurelia TaxID=43138 RepID=A0A8S1WXL5_9CILI|nr:unnamed protein product [Paramecium pentaurelia]
MQHFVTGILQSFGLCGLRNKLVHFVAFRPPEASYELRLRKSNNHKSHTKQKYISSDDNQISDQSQNNQSQTHRKTQSQYIQRRRRYIRNSEEYPEYDFIKLSSDKSKDQNEDFIVSSDICSVTAYFLNQKKNKQMACVYLNRNSDQIILFSHGNACDLGMMIDKLIKLVQYTNTSVFAYEYSGYGQSDGVSNDINIIRNIYTAYNFLIHQLGYKATQIIVYGYSIGSGPSVTLASNPQYPIGGLIIQSGFSSGLRVISNKIDETPFYDMFPNIDRIQLVSCPVFIMHGANDKIISDEHARQLASKTNNLYELWIPENVGHCGIETDIQNRQQYFQKLQKFIQHIQMLNESIPDLLKKNTALIQGKIPCKSHFYQTKIF